LRVLVAARDDALGPTATAPTCTPLAARWGTPGTGSRRADGTSRTSPCPCSELFLHGDDQHQADGADDHRHRRARDHLSPRRRVHQRAHTNVFPNGVVSITAKDPSGTQLPKLRPQLDAYGWRGTLYPIIDQIGAPNNLKKVVISLHDDYG
jgi:hypothetical protein